MQGKGENKKKSFWTLPSVLALTALLSCSASRKAVAEAPSMTPDERQRYEYYYMEAVNQEQQENYDVAFDLLQHCLEICPTAPSALHELSRFYDVLGERTKALELMKQAVQYDPTNYWYQEDLAEAYYNANDYESAIAIYEEMYERFPKRSTDLLPILINLYKASHQYDKELTALDALEEKFGSNEEIGMEKFRAHWLMKDTDGAFDEMHKLIDDNPDDTRFQLMLAELDLDHSRYEEARMLYEAVLKKEPENDNAHLGIANWNDKTGHPQRAHEIVDSLVVYGHLSDEQRLKLTAQLIAQYSQQQDTLAIDSLFSRAMAQPQKSIAMAEACVSYYIDRQKPDSIITPFLHTILSVEPDNISALKQLLYYAVEHNDTQEVRERSNALLSFYPDELYAYYYLVITSLRDNDKQQAIDYCKEGISRIDNESDTELCNGLYSMLGDLYFSQDRDEEGYVAYDSALVYNPSDVSVLNNYAYNLSLENRYLDKAEEMSRVAISKEPDNSTYLDTYAWILYMKERYEESRLYIDQAIRNDTTNNSVLLDHAGDIYWHCDLTAEAIDFWRNALKAQQESYADEKPTKEDLKAEEKLKRKIRLKKWIK